MGKDNGELEIGLRVASMRSGLTSFYGEKSINFSGGALIWWRLCSFKGWRSSIIFIWILRDISVGLCQS